METQTIQASARTEHGKGVARKLRRSGRIPAVAYGAGGEATSLSLNPAELHQLRKSRLGWNMPVTIEVDGGETIALALLRDVQKHPISRQLLHADFLRVADGETVTVRVPIRLEGKAAGSELGGRIAQPRRFITLVCQPALIPEAVVIDITPLEINDKVTLSELPVPDGCTTVYTTDVTVVACVGRRGGLLDEDELDEDAEGAEGAEEGAEDGDAEAAAEE